MKAPCGKFALPCVLLFALLTLTGILTGGPGAVQAQSLSCNMSNAANNWNINFGNYTGNTLAVSSPGTLHIECANPTDSARHVYLCVGLGMGTGGNSVDDRRMKNGDHALQYQLYRDNARTQVFGPVQTSSNIHYSAVVAAHTTASLNTNLYLHGQLFGNQAPGAPGVYLSQFNATHLEVKWQDYAPHQMPALCGALINTMGGNFSVQTQAQTLCTVSVLGHINFPGLTPASDSYKTTTGRIRVQCAGDQPPYKVEMRDGLYAQNTGAANAVRRLRHTTQANQYVTYDLYRNMQFTQRWGRISNNQHLASDGCSNTNGCNHNVYARTDVVGSNVLPGSYTDTVEVVVEY